jgi:uncharacterized protein DUF4153
MHQEIVDARRDPPSNRRRVATWSAALAIIAGLAFDLGLRGGVANGVVAAALMTVSVMLLVGGRLSNAHARVLAASAIIPAGVLAVRASPWLAFSNVITAAALLGSAICYSRSGSVFDTNLNAVVHRARAALPRAGRCGELLRPLVPARQSTVLDGARRAGFGALVAVPILAVVVALLASADAVFARLVLPDLDPWPVTGHLCLIGVFAVCVLAAAAAAAGDADDGARTGRLGSVEIVTMLGLAAGVLALFVASQLLALTDAGRRLIEDSGVTPAQYARSGFFQLCWATAVLAAFLAVVRAVAAPHVLARPFVRVLAGLVPTLALGLVVVSLRRMQFYDRAFGLTMLRLWVVGGALWLGGLLVMMALHDAGVGSRRRWVLGGAGVWAVALVSIASVGNPEAFVVHHNVARARSGRVFDAPYLVTLSDDAVPALADELTHASPALRAQLELTLGCDRRASGVATRNLAVGRAARIRHELCPLP